MQLQAGNRQFVEPDSVEVASWRSLTKGSAIHQHPNISNVDISAASDHQLYSSEDQLNSICSLEPQFNQAGQPVSNAVLSMTSDHIGDESRVGADIFKMTEVFMESRSTKSRDFEVLIHATLLRLQIKA